MIASPSPTAWQRIEVLGGPIWYLVEYASDSTNKCFGKLQLDKANQGSLHLSCPVKIEHFSLATRANSTVDDISPGCDGKMVQFV